MIPRATPGPSPATSTTGYRAGHTATLLTNGQVLVAGGGYIRAELYDPVTGVWTYTGSLVTERSDHTATRLPNGKVLVAGGSNTTPAVWPARSSMIRPPATGPPPAASEPRANFTPPRCCPMARCSSREASTLLTTTSSHWPARSCMIRPPASGRRRTASTPARRSHRHAAAQWQGARRGRWRHERLSLASAELYDPATGVWTPTGSLNAARGGQPPRC